jgi:hypothetical protein
MRGAPIFIVGCGRSGTTALGELLGTHPDIKYLNEPRNFWRTDPRTDVWTGKTPEGRIDLYDVPDNLREELRKALFKKPGKDQFLVEKTPVNSFRIDYLRALFPKARFVHLLRSGLDVARSIQKRVEVGGPWYGKEDTKWLQLTDYARRQGLGGLADRAGDHPRLRGLVEWRLAVSHVRERLRESDLELRYETLVERPRDEVDRLLEWMGAERILDASPLARRSEPITEIDPDADAIAGDLLRELGYPAPSNARR